MILKHFIPNDPRIRFDIEESKTPPEEPFNPFPNLLGYELIVNEYMELVMNRESVETTPLQTGEVEKSKEPETKQEDNEKKEEEEETKQDNDEKEEQENEGKENAVVGQQGDAADINLESKIKNAKNSLNQIIQTKDPTKAMMKNNADAEKENEKLDILMKLNDQQEHIKNALEKLTNSKGNNKKKEKLNKLMREISAGPPLENIDAKIEAAIMGTNTKNGFEKISTEPTNVSAFKPKINEIRDPNKTTNTNGIETLSARN